MGVGHSAGLQIGVLQDPTSDSNTQLEASFIDVEIQELLHKHAIAPSFPHLKGFSSTIVLVQKKGGDLRLVLNLKELNQWLLYRHFKMEGIHLLCDLLQEGDWMVRLDLKGAYLTVPIFPPSQKIFAVSMERSLVRFFVLPFGLQHHGPSPR